MRKVGDIMLNMEALLEELCEEHDLQHGEVLNLVHGWLMLHAPESREEYLDDSHPVFYYGP